jgi:hypothetical protein
VTVISTTKIPHLISIARYIMLMPVVFVFLESRLPCFACCLALRTVCLHKAAYMLYVHSPQEFERPDVELWLAAVDHTASEHWACLDESQAAASGPGTVVDSMIEHEAIEKIIRVMLDYPDDASLQARACRALLTLLRKADGSVSPSALRRLRLVNGVIAVWTAVLSHAHSATVQHYGVELLGTLPADRVAAGLLAVKGFGTLPRVDPADRDIDREIDRDHPSNAQPDEALDGDERYEVLVNKPYRRQMEAVLTALPVPGSFAVGGVLPDAMCAGAAVLAVEGVGVVSLPLQPPQTQQVCTRSSSTSTSTSEYTLCTASTPVCVRLRCSSS